MVNHKLRIIQERKGNIEVENDLRGLGFDPTLKKAYREIFLSTKNLDEKGIEYLFHDLNLKNEKSVHKNISHITCHRSDFLPHKEQAVILFCAGLHILKKYPQIRLYLGQLSYFHYYLALSLGKKKEAKRLLPDEVIKKWVKENEKFTLEVPIQHYLKQVGFEIMPREMNYSLSKEEIETCYNSLITLKTRKAAQNE